MNTTVSTTMHLFDAPSYDALTPDTPTLCGKSTVAEMDYDPRTDPPRPAVWCAECVALVPTARHAHH